MAEFASEGGLPKSLQNPDSAELAEQGLEEWARGLPEEDAEALVNGSAGKPVRRVPGDDPVESRE